MHKYLARLLDHRARTAQQSAQSAPSQLPLCATLAVGLSLGWHSGVLA